MELIPIIKLALIVFSTVLFFVILISYAIYKARSKKNDTPGGKKSGPSNGTKIHRSQAKNESHVYRRELSKSVQVAMEIVPQREVKRVPVLVRAQPRYRERFKIVNDQSVNYKIFETKAEKPRVFYHPNTQGANNSFSFKAKSENILDNYSLPNEPLRKLALK